MSGEAGGPSLPLLAPSGVSVWPPKDQPYHLLLFISGGSTLSSRAVRHVEMMCDEHLRGRHALTIVDVHADWAGAQRHRVLGTPTLIREGAEPERRHVGDFADHLAVLASLGIPSDGPGQPPGPAAAGSDHA